MASCGRERSGDSRGVAASVGSVAAAALSSACCWLPLLLLVMGVSSAGVSSAFERWRPVFLAVAAVLLAVGFWSVYFRGSCAGGSCGRRIGVARQVLLWASAAVVAGMAAFPWYVGAVTRAFLGVEPSGAGISHVYRIEGMTCEACAASLEADLASVEGVTGVRVDYGAGTAEVWAEGEDPSGRVSRVVEGHGFRVGGRSR